VNLDLLKFDNSFAKLGDEFFTRLSPTGLPNPFPVHINQSAAALLGISTQADTEAILSNWLSGWCSGNTLPQGSDSLAMIYSGHQFGGYSPELGDGRGLLLGEAKGPTGKWDVHLKGSGKTPYSRFGDGRAVLRSTIREYLCSEAMHALGVSTTRALSIFSGEETVQRERPEKAAMLIRLARSHIRFGSFEYFHHTQKMACVKKLAEHVIESHFPELKGSANQYLEMFRCSVHRTAKLIAQWQSVGFAHGVMNTDNMSIIGETMDYGPFGFMDNYNPDFICNHSDTSGRYSFKKQPAVGLWNCNALANALTSLVPTEQLIAVLKEYKPLFIQTLLELHRLKLGLQTSNTNDQSLIDELLKILEDNQIDYTIFFRRLCFYNKTKDGRKILENLFIHRDQLDQWMQKYQQRLSSETISPSDRTVKMASVNPKYIFRNYMAEIAIRKAEDEKDYTEISRMLKLLQSPYDEHPDCEEYAKNPPKWSGQLSVSCSS